ncbi:MarR family winged helix-turn-helix transcriptional regulator [Amycolatopsis thermophila]|uniref:DNA-binding MarR family transcriptional regulator n=1 Tax=Amycolatopsis thermophila TaxID=206084 RepID=A0ABU0F591_9PSEU|nr:MarR family transcriptional regulator [Amycolatopsis thermophila]MDQ0382759.1 DNA-binding MarR family transcriptional regulator [Amycolatopsis thermophila]
MRNSALQVSEELDDVVADLLLCVRGQHGELSPTAAAVFGRLARVGPDLATYACLSRPATSALVARLCGQELVRRERDSADKRAVVLSATPAGARLVDCRRTERAARLARASPGCPGKICAPSRRRCPRSTV